MAGGFWCIRSWLPLLSSMSKPARFLKYRQLSSYCVQWANEVLAWEGAAQPGMTSLRLLSECLDPGHQVCDSDCLVTCQYLLPSQPEGISLFLSPSPLSGILLSLFPLRMLSTMSCKTWVFKQKRMLFSQQHLFGALSTAQGKAREEPRPPAWKKSGEGRVLSYKWKMQMNNHRSPPATPSSPLRFPYKIDFKILSWISKASPLWTVCLVSLFLSISQASQDYW